MAIGYQYYEIHEFPTLEVGQEIKSIRQSAIFPEAIDDAPQTIIRAQGAADYKEFLKYYVKHESFESVKGRYNNERITGYIAEHNFHLFQHRTNNVLLIDARQKWAHEMVDRVQKTSGIPFNVSTRQIDLARLAREVRANIRGGWFGSLKIEDVSTIGLFGYAVGESELWDAYDQMGTLKSIDIEMIASNGAKQLVKIGPSSTVVLYSKNSEEDALRFVMEIQTTLDGFTLNQN